MEIRENTTTEEWESFLLSEKSIFLQSSLWGNFKKKYQKVKRIEARENEKIIGVCQIFEEKSPFGKYLYIPFGPVSKRSDVRERLINEALKEAKKEGHFFLRVEPLHEIMGGFDQFSRIQPQKTLISRIDKSKEEQLKDFHSSTRYNIRYAKRKGVLIRKGGSIDDFYNLLLKTKERQRFFTYSKEYFQDLLDVKNTEMISAFYKEKVIAATILFYFNKTVNFLHSAFDYDMRKFKATALLRYDSIELAKEKECIYYDFWGIDEKRFPGVTEYKKSFGGEELIYPPGKDFPIKKFPYLFYKKATLFKKKLR
jgi:peptidoglycan pentaglycine glycine transferase (the first glycine)